MSNAKDIIRKAKVPERVVKLYLDPGLADEFDRLEAALEAAQAKPSRLGGNPEAKEIARQIEALREEMEDSRIDFRLRKLDRTRWRELVAAHPPRQGDNGEVLPRDRYIGVNSDTFPAELVRECVVEPELDDEDWLLLFGDPDSEDPEARVGRLNTVEFDMLFAPAWDLNRGTVDVPFSVAASRILTSEAE